MLPSCMVAPNRELANILTSLNTYTFSIPMVNNNNNMDMEIDILRRRLVNSSANISRALSAYLSVSSISYVKRMEVQNNNPS